MNHAEFLPSKCVVSQAEFLDIGEDWHESGKSFIIQLAMTQVKTLDVLVVFVDELLGDVIDPFVGEVAMIHLDLFDVPDLPLQHQQWLIIEAAVLEYDMLL